jgi:hypothetical protein
MEHKERLKFFGENYDVIGGGAFGGGVKIYIGQRTPRRCRFCKRTEGETTFSNLSHAIPQFLGNRQLILLEECDTCNAEFSENLEDHLDKFTRPYRTLSHIRGANKIPAYKSKDSNSRIIVEKDAIVKIYQSTQNSFISDETEESFRLTLDFEPHTPAAVYKALVKIALSLIEAPSELSAFEVTTKWIKEKDHSKSMLVPLTLLTSFIPGFLPTAQVSTIFLRRKPSKCRVSVDNIPRLWRYLVCQEALEGLSEDLKAKLRC